MGVRSRGLGEILAVFVAIALASCASNRPGPGASASPGGRADLQLRPVLSATIPATAACKAATAPADQLLTLCSDAPGQMSEFVLGPASVTGADVVSATPKDGGAGSAAPVVEVTLTAAGRAKLSKLTGSLAGKTAPLNFMAIVSGGKIIGLPYVQGQMDSSTFDIAVQTMTQAEQLALTVGG